MTARLLFLCAQGSGRALLAASLLHALSASQWEAWSTPPREEQEKHLLEQVLQEQDMPLLPSDRMIQPMFGLRWEQGIVLCSGGTDT
jgi:hypothetical protein